jgi:hypothetical protein
LSRKDLEAYLSQIEDATITDSWTALAAFSNDNAKAPAERAYSRTAVFVKEYISAYFRNGHFIQAKVDFGGLKKKLLDEITRTLGHLDSDGQQRALIAALIDQLNSLFPGKAEQTIQQWADALAKGQVPGDIPDAYTVGKISDGAFVSRGGTTYQFPALTLSFDPLAAKRVMLTKVNLADVGTDLVRTLVEAVLDARFGVPGVETATGIGVKYRPLRKYDSTKDNVSVDQFAQISSLANTVEGVAGSAIGRLVRGAGWISLNNEALASMVETIVGVAAQKVTEKVLWCRFACVKSAADAAAFTAEHGRLMKVRVSLVDISTVE